MSTLIILKIIVALVVIGSFLSLMLLFLIKRKDKSDKERIYLLGISIFFLLYAISRIADLTIILSNEYQEYEIRNIPIDIFVSITGALALLALILSLEYAVLNKKTKFIFSIVETVFIIFALIFSPTEGRISVGRIFIYLASAPAIIIPIIYFYIGYQTSGETKIRAIGAGIGFIIAFLGIVINTLAGKMILILVLDNLTAEYVKTILFGILVPLGLVIYYRSVKY